jgi:dTMP kinase
MAMFIALEGLDGSGQSTQAQILANTLKPRTLLTKEPTNNLIGGLIRAQLTGEWKSSPECLQLLFAADRAHHLEREIEPALKKGVHVITDRYFFSSVAYGALNLDWNWLVAMNTQFRLPDHTFFLDVPPKACIERMQKSRLELELFEKEEYLAKVYKNYLKMEKELPNFHVIPGEGRIEEVHESIMQVLRK